MISQRDLKYYSSLLIKKFRNKEKKFIVEGLKIVEEGLASNFNCEVVFATPAFIESSSDLIEKIRHKARNIIQLKSNEFLKISDTRSPQGIAAVFNFSTPDLKFKNLKEKFILLIDNISDPGNLGTILRTCDWFGIDTVLISNESVEVLNPKVIRASMGSVFHLNIYENISIKDLTTLKEIGYQIICSDLRGKDIFNFSVKNKSIITFSNESAGLSEAIKNIADDFITIPKKGKAESLNVSIAAAIILSKITN